MNQVIRILYAEDNPQDADLTRGHFSLCAPEFQIENVATGQACLERLSTDQFDLLLLDNRLPDMDGITVLKALARNGVQVPVVLVTGSGDENLVVKALRLGAANYVPKSGNYLEAMPQMLHAVVAGYRSGHIQGLPYLAPVHILYVEPSPTEAEVTRQYFADTAPNFVLDVVSTGAEAMRRLQQPGGYDLALLELQLPGKSGLDIVMECKQSGLALPPFIIVSIQGGDAAVITALQLGAVNYIAKREGYLNQLVYTIDQAIARHRLNLANQQLQSELAERQRIEAALRENETRLHEAMRALQQREETITQQATHDELTGLPNRRLFYDRLERAIAEARRYNRHVALIFVDLDHFKHINDTLGHEAGDKFLVAVAQKLLAVPRTIDTCARLGGDEFAVVLPGVENQKQVERVAQRILHALSNKFRVNGVSLQASASLGIAIFPDDADDVPALLKCADVAMYQAKEEGRNAYRFWTNQMKPHEHRPVTESHNPDGAPK